MAFNEEPGSQRLLVLLSPTCPKCIAGASGQGELLVLTAAAAQSLRTLVVWMPVIATDIAPPTSAKLALIPGAHVRQFWDPGHLVLALGRANLCCRRSKSDPLRRSKTDPPSGYVNEGQLTLCGRA